VALYKSGYHQYGREIRNLKAQRKNMQKEIQRLKNVVSMHEEIFYNFDFSGRIGGYLVTLEKK
jgi:hypothetical protein